jgi:sulfite reductase (NADPH) flavoprotein alpha-component
MTLTRPPPIVDLIGEDAPFTAEQRAWLNGFFAALLSLEGTATALSPAEAAALIPRAIEGAVEARAAQSDGDEGEAPWHDQTMLLGERMKLAEGRPLRRRMMAAMAQQDCGQCGYDCERYSEAIFVKQETRLNLCVPGGKETARMLKALYAELDHAPPAAPTIVASPTPETVPPLTPGYARDHPLAATFLSRTRLNAPGSEKETWHIDIDLGQSGVDYAVGDALGVFASNDPRLADAVIAAINAPPDFPIGGRTLRQVLIDGVSLSPAPDMLFELISFVTGGERRRVAKALAAGEDPDGDAETLDVLAAIEKFGQIRPDPEAFIESLDPLQPRLYSIASSPKASPGRVSLTVDAVRYMLGERLRLGLASTFLAERVRLGDTLKVYVQRAHGFSLPAGPHVPIIMIGPGTGIAPFRAFLQERLAINAPGRNWLFFGHQRRNTDFFYEQELIALKAAGVLTHLSLAWSRDSEQKFYVQDRMRELGRELWSWLADGAHIYVCGDAKRMAKDVERALVDIVAQHGLHSTEQASAFVADLKLTGRYQQDVY